MLVEGLYVWYIGRSTIQCLIVGKFDYTASNGYREIPLHIWASYQLTITINLTETSFMGPTTV